MRRMMEGMGQQSRAQSRSAAQIALNRIARSPINENMVKAGFTIISLATALCAALLLVTSAGRVLEIQTSANAAENIEFVSNPVVQKVPPRPPEPVPAATATKVDGATLPPAVNAVLKSGVLIVISKPSQTMYVFKDGALWNSSPVSTGKRGHTTPSGMFPSGGRATPDVSALGEAYQVWVRSRFKGVGGTWTWEQMDAWLASPRKFAAGTKMSFAGLGKPEDRANLMAWLNTQGSNIALPPPPVEEPEEGDAPAQDNGEMGEQVGTDFDDATAVNQPDPELQDTPILSDQIPEE